MQLYKCGILQSNVFMTYLSPWLPTTEARVQSWVSPCGTWGGQICNGACFPTSTLVFYCRLCFYQTGRIGPV